MVAVDTANCIARLLTPTQSFDSVSRMISLRRWMEFSMTDSWKIE